MEKIEKLNWDTDLFGYNVGKIVIQDDDSLDLENLLTAENDNFRLIYIFSEKKLYIPQLNILETDQKIILEKTLHVDDVQFDKINDCVTFICGVNDYSSLESLALESGKYSRFKIDEKFNHSEFEKLYKQWIVKSVKKEISEEVFVYFVNKIISGFITVSSDKKIGTVGLIAVSPEHQGKGIGSRLLQCAETYFLKKGISILQVSTQKRNEMAMRLYLKNGFKIKNLTYIYHYWKN